MKNNFQNLIFLPFLSIVLLVSCNEPSRGEEKVKELDTTTAVTLDTESNVLEIEEKTSMEELDAIVLNQENSKVEKGKVDVEKQETKLQKKQIKESTAPSENLTAKVDLIENKGEELIVEIKIDHALWSDLLGEYVSSSGKVNYKGFKTEKIQLENYINLLKTTAPQSDWSKNEKLAYWINVYNAFTVKLIVDNYPLKSITNLDKPWDKKWIEIGGNNYSLGDVENNILRKMGESRIHFAINCASVSCPKLFNKAFTAEDLNSQLRSVTQDFFNDNTKNNLTNGDLKISKLFEWYASDFSNGNILEYINKYSGKTVSLDSKLSYLEYDWNLNE